MLPSRHALPAASAGRRIPSYAVLPAAAPAAGGIGYIKHPSTGFRPADWRPWFQELLAEAQLLHPYGRNAERLGLVPSEPPAADAEAGEPPPDADAPANRG